MAELRTCLKETVPNMEYQQYFSHRLLVPVTYLQSYKA